MDKFKRIKIQGYRRLEDIDLEMRPLMVLIGANGSGKTSFLDTFSLLAASARGNLQDELSEQGGISEVLTRGKAHQLRFFIHTNTLKGNPFQYELVLKINGFAYEIVSESLIETEEYQNMSPSPYKHISTLRGLILYQDAIPDWDMKFLETALSQVPKTDKDSESFRRGLAGCTYYGSGLLNVSKQSPIRLPQTLRPATLPGVNGENLVSYLYTLKESDTSRFEQLTDIISAAFPDFKGFGFPLIAAGTATITWLDKNYSQPMYLRELSEGTLRFLWLVALLQSSDLPTITLLDEPELSLHPELLRHLVPLLRDASERTQLIVATHSDRLVRFLEPKEIVVCDLEDGSTKMTWADSFPLAKWLEDYTLDQLWAMNIFGGRP